MKDQIQSILDGNNPIISVSEQPKLKAALYFMAKVVRNQRGRLILRDDLTLRFRVKTKQALIDVIWHGSEESPRIAK